MCKLFVLIKSFYFEHCIQKQKYARQRVHPGLEAIWLLGSIPGSH